MEWGGGVMWRQHGCACACACAEQLLQCRACCFTSYSLNPVNDCQWHASRARVTPLQDCSSTALRETFETGTDSLINTGHSFTGTYAPSPSISSTVQ
eukprot:scaffold133139_cov17-Tisochrysis_lutea.AAC.2